MTAALEGGEESAARPGRILPPGKSRCPLYRSLGGPQGRSGKAENLVPTGIRSRTVQPLAQSLYRLSYPAHHIYIYIYIYIYSSQSPTTPLKDHHFTSLITLLFSSCGNYCSLFRGLYYGLSHLSP